MPQPPAPGSLCRATILPTKDGRYTLIVSRWFDGPNRREFYETDVAAAQRLLELLASERLDSSAA